MCGIVGYVGAKNSIPILIEGLKRLEYRGYDSAGIGIIDEGECQVIKTKGKVSQLEEKHDGSYQGPHPIHGSSGGNNFSVNVVLPASG